jgi:hypothetical protein
LNHRCDSHRISANRSQNSNHDPTICLWFCEEL